MSGRVSFATLAWPQAADALGFSAPLACGARGLDGFALRCEGEWLALVDRQAAPDDSRSSPLGAPGLWRVVPDGAGRARVHAGPPVSGFEPLSDEDRDPSLAALSGFLEWATATRDGERQPEWTPPPREEVEAWFEPSRLRVRSGALLASGELVHQTGRLALVYPELASVPEGLTPARQQWLASLLLDAQRRWRMVRFGIDAQARCVVAEVDLSGVPSAWARPCVQLSLEALSWAVEWVLSSLSFLVDTSATSRALERLAPQRLSRSTSS